LRGRELSFTKQKKERREMKSWEIIIGPVLFVFDGSEFKTKFWGEEILVKEALQKIIGIPVTVENSIYSEGDYEVLNNDKTLGYIFLSDYPVDTPEDFKNYLLSKIKNL
jgi:hypothetical protein